jgi:hypothetical protein
LEKTMIIDVAVAVRVATMVMVMMMVVIVVVVVFVVVPNVGVTLETGQDVVGGTFQADDALSFFAVSPSAFLIDDRDRYDNVAVFAVAAVIPVEFWHGCSCEKSPPFRLSTALRGRPGWW